MKWLKLYRECSLNPDSSWKNVFFADESEFNIRYFAGMVRVWKIKGGRLNPKYIKETVKFGGSNIMVWGCVVHNGMVNPAYFEDSMVRFQDVGIVSNNLKPSAVNLELENFIYQQNNDPKHTSKHSKEFFDVENYAQLPRPSQSPRLNPNEHVWAYIELQLTGKMFRNKKLLKEAVIEIRNNTPSNNMQKTVGPMEKRIFAVFNANAR